MRICSKKITTLLQINKLTIFALLIKKFTIPQRQLATLFFMLIFIAVQVIKVGHTHDNIGIKTNTTSKANIEKASYSCSICDYDFAKDKDHYFFSIVIKNSSASILHLTQNILTKPTSIGAVSSDRGPPAFLL